MTDLALKSARIVNLCGKSSGFADFENTVDRGSAVIFDANSGLWPVLSIRAGSRPKQPATGQSLAGYFLLT